MRKYAFKNQVLLKLYVLVNIFIVTNKSIFSG